MLLLVVMLATKIRVLFVGKRQRQPSRRLPIRIGYFMYISAVTVAGNSFKNNVRSEAKKV